MTGIRAGRLRDRVTIQSPPAGDSYGQQTGAWTKVAVRSCSIEPLNGREYYAQGGEVAEQKVRVRFRFERGLLTNARRLVDYRNSPATVYDIEDVIDPGNEHRELICMCVVRQ